MNKFLSGNLVKQGELVKSHNHSFSVSGSTNGMSGNSTGGPWSSEFGASSKGAVYMSGNTKGETGGASGTGDAMYLNIQHTHSFSASGTTQNTGGAETRPANFTMRIWKRIA